MPSEISILAELNQPPNSNSSKKSSALFAVITTVLAFGSSLAWIYATKHLLNDNIKTKIFSKNPLTTLDQSINLLSEIGFYAALYMVSLTFTIMMTRIFNHSINPAVMGRLEPAEKMNQLIRSFTQALIMFACLFLYFLEKSKSTCFVMQESAKSKAGFFLPFWFLTGYAAIAIGYLLEIVFKRDIGVTRLGQFVLVWTFGILLAEIGDVKVFKLI